MDYAELRDSRAGIGVVLNKTIWLRSGLLLAVLCLVAAIKWETAGWFLITWGILLYPTVIAFHCVTHALALWRPDLLLAGLRVVAISHLLLLIGFLLQYDEGDSDGWFAIARLCGWEWGRNIYEEHWWTEYRLLINLLAFVPVTISWAFMIRVIARPSASKLGMES